MAGGAGVDGRGGELALEGGALGEGAVGGEAAQRFAEHVAPGLGGGGVLEEHLGKGGAGAGGLKAQVELGGALEERDQVGLGEGGLAGAGEAQRLEALGVEEQQLAALAAGQAERHIEVGVGGGGLAGQGALGEPEQRARAQVPEAAAGDQAEGLLQRGDGGAVLAAAGGGAGQAGLVAGLAPPRPSCRRRAGSRSRC